MRHVRRQWLLAALIAPSSASAQEFGPIFFDISKPPSAMESATGLRSVDAVEEPIYLACYDASNGHLQDCGFDYTITGLHGDSVEDTAGHTHGGTHPLGLLQLTEPFVTDPATFQEGRTLFRVLKFVHKMPVVSGRIDTLLNLRVPPGWHTVFPQPCDTTHTSWCFITTVDVGVPDLVGLPDGDPTYQKIRAGAPQHTDDVAYFGTNDTNAKLTEIAHSYFELTNLQLSINDMSLIKGGLFDHRSDYFPPHKWHRTGESADINKPDGEDCRTVYDLQLAVALAFSSERTSFLPRRRQGFARFVCETSNNNNIHIDFDRVPAAAPLR